MDVSSSSGFQGEAAGCGSFLYVCNGLNCGYERTHPVFTIFRGSSVDWQNNLFFPENLYELAI